MPIAEAHETFSGIRKYWATKLSTGAKSWITEMATTEVFRTPQAAKKGAIAWNTEATKARTKVDDSHENEDSDCEYGR